VQLLLLLSSLAVVAIGSAVAARLLALARRTRQLPELLIGVGLGSFAAVAYPLLLVGALAGSAFAPSTRRLLIAASTAAYCVTLAGLAAFNYAVYRRGARWAQGLAAALFAVCALGGIVGVSRFDPVAAAGATDPVAGVLMAVAYAVAFGWASVEALRYRGLLRRRVRVGVGQDDPVVMNRFLVWGLGTAVAALIDLALLGYAMRGLDLHDHPMAGVLQAASGLVCSTSWYLTFMPPARYLDWIRGAA
jgi:hypothetical protein